MVKIGRHCMNLGTRARLAIIKPELRRLFRPLERQKLRRFRRLTFSFCPFCAVQLGDAPKFSPSCGQNVEFLTRLAPSPSLHPPRQAKAVAYR
ncbi:unnamed protein product [Boreogadus saida]